MFTYKGTLEAPVEKMHALAGHHARAAKGELVGGGPVWVVFVSVDAAEHRLPLGLGLGDAIKQASRPGIIRSTSGTSLVQLR